ncbi:MAG TPA: hypothetical protein VK524_16590 [Polyangiaceae bacterium]|nr:hypothetical protein [Polyangiaceae bacterium]
MRNVSFALAGAIGVIALFGLGCSSKPAAPFDTLKTANLTAFRLQNYEPPPTAVPAPGGGIPGLPTEIQSWIQQGAQGLQQLIPPGLLPPGMIPQPGQQAPGAVAVPGVQDTTPRFHGFRILGQTPVIDSELKEDLAKLFGDDDNFTNQHQNCLYAEMGLSFGGNMGGPSNDLLVSFSCNQVQAKTFAWPHPASGMKPGTVKELSEIVQKLWPAGS